MDKVSLKSVVPQLGSFLKLFREKTGQNQSDIASGAGISISMLSQIERGIVSPSIDTLVMVCTALNLDPGDLFKLISTNHPVRIHHEGERLTMENRGTIYEQLMTCSHGAYQAEMFLLEVKSGCDTALSSEGHEGVEIGFALQGKAVLKVNNTDYHITKGDSMFFNSNLPHQLFNPGPELFRAVWSISPPHVDYLADSSQGTGDSKK